MPCQRTASDNLIHVDPTVWGQPLAELLLFLPERFAAPALTRVSANMLLIKLSAWFVSPHGCRLQRQKEDEMDRCLRECKVEPALRECRSLLSRPSQNQRAKAQGDSMLFSDDVFTLEPLVSDS